MEHKINASSNMGEAFDEKEMMMMRLPSYIEEPFEEWRASFRFYVETTVRFSETDMFGHMNNVTPFVYFEEARIAFFFQKNGNCG
ncbi:hypothetical protein BsIDN1_49820 [Bacillus safensis]|uniref:Thioesterase domain-containing protein n=1 Tax=Bacillus safensis TaxID=561879 RepID=A0A5S9MGU2_BACIA|nr:hypothetical protein BsIDN1_49820 [Bacillus safensis]